PFFCCHPSRSGGSAFFAVASAPAVVAAFAFAISVTHAGTTRHPSSSPKIKSMSTQLVRPARNLQGSLTLPGDKSISHRYAMLAGIAEGTTRLSNFSTGADPHSSLACMQALGSTIAHDGEGAKRVIEITGVGGAFVQ